MLAFACPAFTRPAMCLFTASSVNSTAFQGPKASSPLLRCVSRPGVSLDTLLEEMMLLQGGGHGETQAK